MAASLLREIKASDVDPDDLDTIEEALLDIAYLAGSKAPLVEFLDHFVESLRAGNDMVIVAAEPAVVAAVQGLER